MSYQELADVYEVELCTGECGRRGHDTGFLFEGRLHFRERSFTRSGLRAFLMLVHDRTYRIPGILPRRVEQAQWIHSRNTWAYREALKLGTRLPRSLSATDRSRVMQLLTGQGEPPVVKALRGWAREG